MRYVFLTALRNEAAILPEFLEEFTAMLRSVDIAGAAVLYVVDDYSTDGSVATLEAYRRTGGAAALEIVQAPTNLGNQGAMFYGLNRVNVAGDDVLITFDCDGEDDVGQIPSIIELSKRNDGRMVLIERGRRAESLPFMLLFSAYKRLFRSLTGRRVIPNNFMLLPGRYVPVIRRSPFAAVHLSYAILKLGTPFLATVRDRRPRYGGKTSQSLYALVSHGMVGLMVFFEVVVAKLFMILFGIGAVAAASVGFALVVSPAWVPSQRVLGAGAFAIAMGSLALLGLLLSASLALILKLTAYNLSLAAEQQAEARLQGGAVDVARRDSPSGKDGTAPN